LLLDLQLVNEQLVTYLLKGTGEKRLKKGFSPESWGYQAQCRGGEQRARWADPTFLRLSEKNQSVGTV